MTNKSVVYIFCDIKKKMCLIEKRINGQSFAGLKVFPGGKVEDDETGNLEKALIREIKEETGVDAIKYVDLNYPTLGEGGFMLYPYLIIEWNGRLSNKVLDKGSRLEWIGLDKFEPELESIKKILDKVSEYVAQS